MKTNNTLIKNTLWYLHIILESLPISSSGHFYLISKIFNLPELSTHDKYIMHIPSAIAILIFLLKHISLALQFNIITLAIYIFIANSFTGILYFLFKKTDTKFFPISLGFIITSCMLISTKYLTTYNSLSYLDSAIIGMFQGLALLPGISRLTSTYFAANALHITPDIAIYFSLLIELPLILAALLLARKNISINHRINLKYLALNMASIIISFYCLELVLYLAENNLIYFFGIYMIIPLIISFFI